jgi:exoribonuclease R
LKAIRDKEQVLAEGLAAIRQQFQLPSEFPAGVEEAAAEATDRFAATRIDRTALDFVTLDPLSSVDLDQAFALEADGADIILHHAIADIGAYVVDGDPIDTEAWVRGETIYLPDGKVSLYPKTLSEGLASVLPDADKAALLHRVRVGPDGKAMLEKTERALVRSRAKLGYATVTDADLPPLFAEFARRIDAAEEARGAVSIEPPQQEVSRDDGHFRLQFRPMSVIAQRNAALSLAANLAIADALLAAGTGLFRVMEPPGKWAISRLHHTAKALGVDWPKGESLEAVERRLDPNKANEAAFMLALRRTGQRATYAPYLAGKTPWHSAVEATYAHATAPLRRLADRYVGEAALAITNGQAVPDRITQAFAKLPKVMDAADAKAAQVDSAVIELAEATAMEGRVGEAFDGRVIAVDDRGAKIQLCKDAVVTRIAADGLSPGEQVELTLTEASPERRLSRFALA